MFKRFRVFGDVVGAPFCRPNTSAALESLESFKSKESGPTYQLWEGLGALGLHDFEGSGLKTLRVGAPFWQDFGAVGQGQALLAYL